MAQTMTTDQPRTGLDLALQQLAEAAERGDTAAFLAAYPLIEWTQRPPEDFILATRLALEAGAHLLAREIATRGAEQHPGHAEMQKYARVLAPPRVIERPLPPISSIPDDHAWLRAHRHEHRGQWVALRNGVLLAAGNTLQEVIKGAGGTEGIFFTKVF